MSIFHYDHEESCIVYPISLFIPRVFSNITKQRISTIFETLDIGKVSNIDFVGKRDIYGKKYNSVYIHFQYWYDSSAAIQFQRKIFDPNATAKLVYDDPWYWIVMENKGKKYVSTSASVSIKQKEHDKKEEHIKNKAQYTSKRIWYACGESLRQYVTALQEVNDAWKIYTNDLKYATKRWNMERKHENDNNNDNNNYIDNDRVVFVPDMYDSNKHFLTYEDVRLRMNILCIRLQHYFTPQIRSSQDIQIVQNMVQELVYLEESIKPLEFAFESRSSEEDNKEYDYDYEYDYEYKYDHKYHHEYDYEHYSEYYHEYEDENHRDEHIDDAEDKDEYEQEEEEEKEYYSDYESYLDNL
jgi:hypothetical protein